MYLRRPLAALLSGRFSRSARVARARASASPRYVPGQSPSSLSKCRSLSSTMLTTQLQVTKPAPDFKATAVMPDGSFKEITLSEFRGKKYVILYFYPLDFTFVCPTEIIAFNSKVQEFKANNVELLGCSVDSHFSHLAWTKIPKEKGGIGDVHHPIISDLTKAIARSYNVLLEEKGIALRGLFLIDKDGILRHQVVNDLPLGRCVEEALRMVDALQFFETHGEVCPANWKKGRKGMKPTDHGVAEYLSSVE